MNKVLIGFSEGDISLWSLYEKKLVMTGSSELLVNGAKLTDVQWLDNKGEKFVSGYDDGSIWLWNVPHEALPKFGPPLRPVNVTPCCKFDYTSATNAMAFSSILSLRCGQASTDGGNHLHIFAHGVTRDGMKAVASMKLDPTKLADKSQVSSQQEFVVDLCKNLPWFGDVSSFCTVEQISSNLELEISSVVALAENSTIHIYDIEQYMPFQVDTPFQRCTPIRCISIERSENITDSSMFKKLLENPEQVFSPAVLASGAPWPIMGGRATAPDAASNQPIEWGLMISGHEDGVARVWDTGYNSLRLLASFPSQDAPSSPVRCLSVSSNLLVLGYENGEMRAFLSASQEKFAYERLVIDDKLEIENVTHDGSPYACLIRSNTHQCEISALQCCVDLGLIACGDTSGTISVIDLEGNILFCGEIFPESSVGSVLLAKRECVDGEMHRCVVVSSDSCSVASVDLDDCKNLPETMTPKNSATFLYASLLDQCSHIIESSSKIELVLPGLKRRPKGGQTAAKDADTSSDLGRECPEDNSSEDDFPDDNVDDESDTKACQVVASSFHLLQCSSGYLRIYPLSGIARGERTTWKKVKSDVPLKLAAAVNRVNAANEASCVVSMDENATLAIWSVPNFEKYWSRGVADVLGWNWNLSDNTKITCSSDGQILIEEKDELIRISLADDSKRNPLASICLHDKEVAEATQAAIAAMAASKTEEEAKTPTKTSSRFSSFITSATSMMTGQMPPPPPAIQPSVQQLHTAFEVVAFKRSVQAQSQPTSSRQDEEEESKNRAKLFSSTSTAAGEKRRPGRRTVDEIKAAYGRDPSKAATSRANELKGVMAENMNKLAERGERLSQLQDKTQQLEDDAEDFMTMAKKLAQREQNKKWWEF